MKSKHIVSYDILDKNGRLLIAAGSELTDSRREMLRRRHDWKIGTPSPFVVNKTMAEKYQRDYERALNRYSGLFNECIRKGGFPSSSLNRLAEFVALFNREIPQYSALGGMSGLDSYTQTHSINVAAICAVLGYYLKLTEPERRDLIAAGLLHDIGKTKVPAKILLAKRKLSPHEFSVVQTHPEIGADIISGSYSSEIVNAVKYHHVRVGSGYPKDVEYDNLSDMVKWVGIADVYEALTADRPYRYKVDPYNAMRILHEESIVNADFQFVRSFNEIFSSLYFGAVVSLSDGTYGVIKGIAERNGIYKPLIVTSNGEAMELPDSIDIRDIVGITEV